MKAIKRELGEDEETVDIKELEDRVKAAKLPEEAEKVAEAEAPARPVPTTITSINRLLAGLTKLILLLCCVHLSESGP